MNIFILCKKVNASIDLTYLSFTSLIIIEASAFLFLEESDRFELELLSEMMSDMSWDSVILVFVYFRHSSMVSD